MVTRSGDQLFYENVKLGWAMNDGDTESIYLAVTDVDNEEIHLVPLALSRLEQFFNLGRQTAAGKKVEIIGANDMPPRPQGA